MEHHKHLYHAGMDFCLTGVWMVLECSCGNTFRYTHRPTKMKRPAPTPDGKTWAMSFNTIKGYE